MRMAREQKNQLDTLFNSKGYSDYRWIDPHQILVAQWVRMKCMFGCVDYGHGAACPPHTPSVSECERFFNEYEDAVIFHFDGIVEKPEERHVWSAKINTDLIKLEREVFLAGFERAFMLPMDSCALCKECTGDRKTCNNPKMARPTVEAMAVDVYTTVRRFGYTINVRTDYNQKMDRFAFLMVR
jgi:predicted metal-binding protein